MAIPKYNEMYRLFLDCLKDGQPHKSQEIKKVIATVMSVTEEEQKKLLPSGKQAIFDNRIGWTSTYLKKAGLIDSPSRGVFVITTEGSKLLAENPAVINNDLLMRYESFRLFKNPNVNGNDIPVADNTEDTPQDLLDNAFKMINTNLADELLAEIMKQQPSFFEALVVKLLEKMGYGGSLKDAGTVVGQSGDEGIDGIIREDKLGFNLIYIQAKRWDINKSIGRPEIQKFVGALAGQGATKGLFVTTAQFSSEALAYAKKQHTTKVILVDGVMLTNLMIEYNLGVTTETVYEIKRIDMDFFSDENN
ncbi:Mrr restriction system protein [Sporotomaculum syntrophicum]|uniref:Mrr restriction system protein n=1 Tax=Sporotomaculum syntrophicum TaxID=182264 RepID=A0A9D3AW91_9FIRM|nr:restriction endonuclease [Sporotomaculum syntrophicum]KAF1085135.1 Mrr restriction system protein [Sporotomaculum syntrophicum]